MEVSWEATAGIVIAIAMFAAAVYKRLVTHKKPTGIPEEHPQTGAGRTSAV